MSMIDYGISILNLVLFVFAALAIIGAFCSVGWLICSRELKKERSLNIILRSRARAKDAKIERLEAKISFLNADINVLNDDLAEIKSEKASIALEKMQLEDRLHKALAAVRTEVDCDDAADDTPPWEDTELACGQPDMEIAEV